MNSRQQGYKVRLRAAFADSRSAVVFQARIGAAAGWPPPPAPPPLRKGGENSAQNGDSVAGGGCICDLRLREGSAPQRGTRPKPQFVVSHSTSEETRTDGRGGSDPVGQGGGDGAGGGGHGVHPRVVDRTPDHRRRPAGLRPLARGRD